jgi:hypothetical protein
VLPKPLLRYSPSAMKELSCGQIEPL